MGIVTYLDALRLQKSLVSSRKNGRIPDTLLSLQHPPTYTLGSNRSCHNLLVPESELQTMGAVLHYSGRGGDITFHGPGQAILYPIISLREIDREIDPDVRKYVENLERTMIKLASFYGVQANAGETGQKGVSVKDKKIGATGVWISSGITSHGLAFNIDPELSYFEYIVPCGISDKGVTSLKMKTELVLPSDEVIHEQLVHCFAESFGFSSLSWKGKVSDLLENT